MLGGPVRKVAHAFAVAGLSAGSFDNQAPWAITATTKSGPTPEGVARFSSTGRQFAVTMANPPGWMVTCAGPLIVYEASSRPPES